MPSVIDKIQIIYWQTERGVNRIATTLGVGIRGLTGARAVTAAIDVIEISVATV